MPVFLEPSLTRFSVKLREDIHDWSEELTVDLEEFPCSILTGINASGKTLSMGVLHQLCDLLVDYDEIKKERLTNLALQAGIEEVRVRFEYEWYSSEREESSKLFWFGLKEDISGYNSPEELQQSSTDSETYRRRLGSDLVEKDVRYGSRSLNSRIIIDFEAKAIRNPDDSFDGELQLSRRDGISFDVHQRISISEPRGHHEPGTIATIPTPRFEGRTFREVILEDEFRLCATEDLHVSGFGPMRLSKSSKSNDFAGDAWREILRERTGIAFDYMDYAGEDYFFEDPNIMLSFKPISTRLLTVEGAYKIDEDTRKDLERDIYPFFAPRGELSVNLLMEAIWTELVKKHRMEFSFRRLCDDHRPTERERQEAMEDWSEALDLGSSIDEEEFRERYCTTLAIFEMYGVNYSYDHGLVDFEDVPAGKFHWDDFGPEPIPFDEQTLEYEMPEKARTLLIESSREFALFHSLSRFLPFIHEIIPEHFSSGQKRLINLLLDISLSPDGSTILIDEPELSMHIDWQEKMVSSLIESFPKHKFILATHAPSMVKDHHDLIFSVPPSGET